MKIFAFLLCFLMFESIICFAQQQIPRRRNEAPVTRTSTEADGSFDSLRQMNIPNKLNPSVKDITNEKVRSLYRKLTKDELNLLSVSPTAIEKHKDFLETENSSIIKLKNNTKCFTNMGLVLPPEGCSIYTMPGLGMAFSFRLKNYRIHQLADLILDGNVIKTDGILQQGIMVKLGDIDLSTITKNTDGVKTLFDFPVASNKKEFEEFNNQMVAGIKKDNFIYRLGFFSTNDTTFALRSIAYKGKVMRTVDGVTYNEIDFDRRKDIVVVFRIIDKNEQGDITIIWKEISERDSPSLKLE